MRKSRVTGPGSTRRSAPARAARHRRGAARAAPRGATDSAAARPHRIAMRLIYISQSKNEFWWHIVGPNESRKAFFLDASGAVGFLCDMYRSSIEGRQPRPTRLVASSARPRRPCLRTPRSWRSSSAHWPAGMSGAQSNRTPESLGSAAPLIIPHHTVIVPKIH